VAGFALALRSNCPKAGAVVAAAGGRQSAAAQALPTLPKRSPAEALTGMLCCDVVPRSGALRRGRTPQPRVCVRELVPVPELASTSRVPGP
jgi:hypothetical protein